MDTEQYLWNDQCAAEEIRGKNLLESKENESTTDQDH
jgi:hypothetical protein